MTPQKLRVQNLELGASVAINAACIIWRICQSMPAICGDEPIGYRVTWVVSIITAILLTLAFYSGLPTIRRPWLRSIVAFLMALVISEVCIYIYTAVIQIARCPSG